MNPISRGILLGGSFGAFAVILGFYQSYFYSIGVGMICGFIAGLTILYRNNRKQK